MGKTLQLSAQQERWFWTVILRPLFPAPTLRYQTTHPRRYTNPSASIRLQKTTQPPHTNTYGLVCGNRTVLLHHLCCYLPQARFHPVPPSASTGCPDDYHTILHRHTKRQLHSTRLSHSIRWNTLLRRNLLLPGVYIKRHLECYWWNTGV